MRDSVVIAIISAVCLLAAACVIGVAVFVTRMPATLGPVHPPQVANARVSLPKGTCPTSLAVCNLRPHGSADARYYAVGFARALADRTFCAPDSVTQQASIADLVCATSALKREAAQPVPEALVAKLGKKLAVRYIVTGDLTLSGNRVSISLYLRDTDKRGHRHVLRASGDLAVLPQLQSKLAEGIVSAMGVTGNHPELSRPNFTRPETLKLYGRSFLADSAKEREQMRWKLVELDPGASFPVVRLLELYYAGGTSCADLRNNRRLNQLISQCAADFPGNSQIAVLRALVLANESEYEQSETILRQVARDDPRMFRAHVALATVARLRMDGELALAESKKAVRIWPNNPYARTDLAYSYSQVASNARNGHYYAEMKYDAERVWRENIERSLEEALISVKLDPDCTAGWFSVLDNARWLSRYDDRRRAYTELKRLDPMNTCVYTSYAFCFSPQWGGTRQAQEHIFAEADRAFPRGSYKPLMVRALSLSESSGSSVREICMLADEISDKAGVDSYDATEMRCQAYEMTGRRADFLAVSEYALKKWGGLEWQYRVGMGYAFAYEDKHKPAYLEKARLLFSDYQKEVPLDSRSYVQVGWCLSHQGKRAEAKAQFLKALKIDPNNQTARDKLRYVQ